MNRAIMLAGNLGLALTGPWGQCAPDAATQAFRSLPSPSENLTGQSEVSQLRRRLRPAALKVETPSELNRLIGVASNAVVASAAQQVEQRGARRQAIERTPLGEMTWSELKTYFSEPRGILSKHERRGCEELIRLAQAALGRTGDSADPASRTALAEVACAMKNDRRPPAPEFVEPSMLPFLFLDYLHNPIGRGELPATNIVVPDGGGSDWLDPPPSSFWSPQVALASQNVYQGFGRAALPRLEEPLWTYTGPKTSYGRWPGFEAGHGKIRIQVKFGETRSEPFTARIFSALGYNVEPTDHAAGLKVRYDRRFFREFHLRKEIRTEVRAAGLLRVWTIHLQPRFDPFDFVARAVLRDGSTVPGPALKGRLLTDPAGPNPEDRPSNFNREFESRIDYLVTVAANVQVKDKAQQNIGPWEFGGLGHEDLRELRGVGLLAAWLGWSDSRFENTRLKSVRTRGGRELKHFFTDLGGSLGKATGPLSCVSESPNTFPWTFTRAPRVQGRGRMTVPFRIVGFQPIDDTPAFEKMTVDDARWMARKIARLAESQIVQALVASGFDSAEVKLYTEKLLSRRDRMILDLGLAPELPLMRPEGPARDLTYDPEMEGTVVTVLPDGQVAAARPGEHRLERGLLLPRRTRAGQDGNPSAKSRPGASELERRQVLPLRERGRDNGSQLSRPGG